MNALDKIKEGVSDGVKAIEGKISQIEADIAGEKAQKEKLKADRAKEKEKQAKARERAKNRKRRSLMARRAISSVLCGAILVAVVAWYTLNGLNILNTEPPVQPLWALGLMAVGTASMITGKGIPVKVGMVALGALILVRDNGWLWGILGRITLWHLIAATVVLVAVIYVTGWIVSIKNGAKRGWRKTKKTIDRKKEDINTCLSETKAKLNGTKEKIKEKITEGKQ